MLQSLSTSFPCFLILNALLPQYFICLSVVLHVGDSSGHKGQLDSRKCTDPARKKKLQNM